MNGLDADKAVDFSVFITDGYVSAAQEYGILTCHAGHFQVSVAVDGLDHEANLVHVGAEHELFAVGMIGGGSGFFFHVV